jgi:hypothetical protein
MDENQRAALDYARRAFGTGGRVPPAAAELAAARHELWTQTAARRAELAAGQADELARLAEQAARRYAVAALAVFNAAVDGASRLEGLEPPGDAVRAAARGQAGGPR